jgi:hypothetical protein
MDSFDASTQFAQILRLLAPSTQLLTRAAHFALKHHHAEDYLVHTIADVVRDPRTDVNTKLTVFHFIEVLLAELCHALEQPKSAYAFPYVAALKQMLPQVLLQTLPGANCLLLYNVYCNLKAISRTLKFGYEEYDLRYNTVAELFTPQDDANIAANVEFPAVTADDTADPLAAAWEFLITKRKQSQYERLRLLRHLEVCTERTVDEERMFSLRGKAAALAASRTPAATPAAPAAPAAPGATPAVTPAPVATTPGAGQSGSGASQSGSGAGQSGSGAGQSGAGAALATPGAGLSEAGAGHSGAALATPGAALATPGAPATAAPTLLLTKRQILARMEDDRESHKRSKETLWMVSRPRVSGVSEDEFLTHYWNRLNPTDATHAALVADLEELNALAALSYKDKQF